MSDFYTLPDGRLRLSVLAERIAESDTEEEKQRLLFEHDFERERSFWEPIFANVARRRL